MLNISIYYFLLVVASIVIFRNALQSYKLNKDFTLVISTFFIYYFTFGGALIFPIDEYTGFKGVEIGLHYLPIFDKLFVVTFNWDYILSIVAYLIFILTFQYSYIYLQKRFSISIDAGNSVEPISIMELRVNPYIVLLLSFSLICFSIFIMRRELSFAIFNEKSIYLITRANTNPLYTIHQLANEFCVLIPFMAYSFCIVKSKYFQFKISDSKWAVQIIFITCIISSVYIAFLGNRREILSGIIVCLLIAFNNIKLIDTKKVFYIFLIVLGLFLANDFFRSTIIPRYLNGILKPKVDKELEFKKDEEEFYTSSKYTKIQKGKQIMGSFLFSNELFYAHFSMYGAIHNKIPITYGSSFKYLASSIIPRAIYPNRPPDIYSHYAKSVNAVPGQLYTMHHATAWYLNFGWIGLVIGACVLALIFSSAFYLRKRLVKSDNVFISYLLFLLPILLSSQIVTFITAGPEAYKSMLLEGIVIPIFLLWLCTKKIIVNKMEL